MSIMERIYIMIEQCNHCLWDGSCEPQDDLCEDFSPVARTDMGAYENDLRLRADAYQLVLDQFN